MDKNLLEKRKQILASRREEVSKQIRNRLWIELHEQKPETDKLILVSLADGTVECAIFNGLTWNHPWNNAHVFEDVIAWQPLPDAYVKQEIEE
ncbi:MAG: hypothetical protein IJ070_03100 [Firmicutes bacterium]|nr:hypothetical protein [Bacillota bacterium]